MGLGDTRPGTGHFYSFNALLTRGRLYPEAFDYEAGIAALFILPNPVWRGGLTVMPKSPQRIVESVARVLAQVALRRLKGRESTGRGTGQPQNSERRGTSRGAEYWR